MNENVKILSSLKVKNKIDSLKCAYAFMQCKQLNMKECSFFNPNSTQQDKDHVFPTDLFSAYYSETDLPSWESFKINPIHLSSPSFNCVGSLDKKDSKRIVCSSIDNSIIFCCYGNYEEESRKVIENIVSSYKILE